MKGAEKHGKLCHSFHSLQEQTTVSSAVPHPLDFHTATPHPRSPGRTDRVTLYMKTIKPRETTEVVQHRALPITWEALRQVLHLLKDGAHPQECYILDKLFHTG